MKQNNLVQQLNQTSMKTGRHDNQHVHTHPPKSSPGTLAVVRSLLCPTLLASHCAGLLTADLNTSTEKNLI